MAQPELSELHSVASVDRLRRIFREVFEQGEVDFDVMNSREPADARVPEYFKLVTAAADLVETISDKQLVEWAVLLVDAPTSLGVQAERLFLRRLGVPVMGVYAVQAATSPEAAIPDMELRRDMATITQFGGNVINLLQETDARLVVFPLREEAA